LATVLREGVTNVLRHSSGEHCEVTLRHQDGVVCLDIVNDGVVIDSALSRYGSGIHNLSDRVSKLGGELTAGLDPDGRFRLRAWVPA
jgi:signal transduction histidine kinase